MIFWLEIWTQSNFMGGRGRSQSSYPRHMSEPSPNLHLCMSNCDGSDSRYSAEVIFQSCIESFDSI